MTFRGPETFGHLRASKKPAEGRADLKMSEIRTTGIAVRIEPFRAWVGAGTQSALDTLGQAGKWFGDTAQKFASLLSDLMGPGVFLAYSLTAWSFASNLGWTGPFLVSTGPLLNWLVCLGSGLPFNVAHTTLKRRRKAEILRSNDLNES